MSIILTTSSQPKVGGSKLPPKATKTLPLLGLYFVWLAFLALTSVWGPLGGMAVFSSPILILLAIAMLVTKNYRWFGVLALMMWLPSFLVLLEFLGWIENSIIDIFKSMTQLDWQFF